MFGKKKKKEEVKYTANGVKKIKVSELPPEERERALAKLREIGESTTRRYEEIMKKRLEAAKANLQSNSNTAPEANANAKANDSDDKQS